MTQARLDWENPRSLWIDGSATFTTVASSTIISIPAHSTTRAIRRERSLGAFRASDVRAAVSTSAVTVRFLSVVCGAALPCFRLETGPGPETHRSTRIDRERASPYFSQRRGRRPGLCDRGVKRSARRIFLTAQGE